jgi:hypothetical protein
VNIYLFTAYEEVPGPWSATFGPCPDVVRGPFTGNMAFNENYYLRIDDNVGNGTYETTTTWSVAPM